jgi:RHS repeat-associated protein
MGALKAYQGSGNDWAYAYDADGERMLVYNASNGSSIFRIRGLDNKPLREVRYSGGVWSWGKDWIYRDGNLLATVALGADGLRHVHADHLGSPRLFTDASGLARERYHYYPFGEQAGSAPTTPEAMRFTGHERDPAASTGTTDDLDYMHARYHNQQLGRFLTVDPAGYDLAEPGSFNRYSYALRGALRSSFGQQGEGMRSVKL